MDIQTLLHNLHEEVSCSVCMTKFTDPKQLPCLHSFCLHCLQRIQRTSGIRENISCPECRQNFRIPGDGDLNALPTNFRINSLLDVLAIKECNTSGVKCGNCDKRSGESYYCFQCCSFWCDDCISLHNGIRANKEHHALALKDFQDQDFENILKRPAFCQQKHHEKEELKIFCKLCEVAVCNICALTDHEGHAKISLESAANERKLRVKTAIESQQRRAQTKMNKIAKLDENSVKVQEHPTRVKSEVQQYVDSIMATIEAKRMKIFDEVENNAKDLLERLGMERQEIEEQVKMHETTIEKSKVLLKRTTSAQIMQPNELIDKLFQEEGDQDDTADRDGGNVPVEFHFVKHEQFFDHVNTEEIGSLQFITKTSQEHSSAEGKGIREATVGLEAHIVVTTRNAQGEQCYEERDCVTVEIRNRQGHDCATTEQVQDKKDGTYKINYFAKETGTCQTSVKVNGEHVHGSPFEVQVKPRQFRPMLSFGQQGSSAGMFSCPWGIAVNEKNDIVVTEAGNHRIQVFSSNGTHLRSFGRKGDQQGEFDCPAGIGFHNCDNIIVVDTLNHRVQLFSDQGEYLGQFGGQGNLDHQLKYPHGLSIDSDGNIIVVDRDNKLIKIFSFDGQLLRKIGTEGSFIGPFHCIQHGNCLVVSDRDDHCVKIFNREGNFLYKFGKKGDGNGEFNSPDCLSVNKAGQLLVCDTLNHRIQVFELNGKFATKFGTQGSKTGQFNKPVSTAVLSDGKIVVADLGNHRVQIFE